LFVLDNASEAGKMQLDAEIETFEKLGTNRNIITYFCSRNIEGTT